MINSKIFTYPPGLHQTEQILITKPQLLDKYKYNNMKQKHGLNKIDQIISLSNNYIQHKKNLNMVRGLVDHSNPKRNIDIDDYLYRKKAYRQARQSINNKSMSKQNEKFVQRLINISDNRNSSRSSTRSNKSLQKTISDKVASYKTRRSFSKVKEVQQQNRKIVKRIKNAKFKDSLGPNYYELLKKENSNFKNVHSPFSARSQTQLKQILDQLKYDHKMIPFLPALSSRRYNRT